MLCAGFAACSQGEMTTGTASGSPGGGVPSNQPPVAAFSATPVNGVAPLRVVVDATASGDPDGSITAYNWYFGDGASAGGAVSEHSYAAAGNYTLTLTVRDDRGAETSTTRTIQVSAGGMNGLLFFDDFNYTVNRVAADSAARTANYKAFRAAGWNQAKAINTTGSYLGNLYTTDTIPGFSGSVPERNSTRVLVMEGQQSLQTYGNNQTDFHLQYGAGGANDPVVLPGNVWFQFWLYVPHTSEQPAWFARAGKFLYPTNCSWPSTCNKWLLGLTGKSGDPLNREGGILDADSPDGRAGRTVYPNVNVSNSVSRIEWTAPGIAPENQWKTGQQVGSDFLVPNRWVLVKIHFDTSSANGLWEMWMRPQGAANWLKIVEYIPGVTPHFAWPLAAPGGHTGLRMPTTLDGSIDDAARVNSWYYLDDFAIATSEAALPTYP